MYKVKAKGTDGSKAFHLTAFSVNQVTMVRVAFVGNEAQALPGPPDGFGSQVEEQHFTLHR